MTFLAPTTSAGGRTMRQRALARNLSDWHDPKGTLRILDTLDAATDEEWQAGLGWYAVAHQHALEVGKGDARKGAGIIAALSPQATWGKNLGMAYAHADGDSYGAPFAHWADAISDGADPEATLGGRKVRSFYRNMLEPMRNGPITIDRHAFAIVTGIHSDKLAKKLERVGVYQSVASHYRTVGRQTGYRGHEVQAVAWLAYRRQRGIVDVDIDEEEF